MAAPRTSVGERPTDRQRQVLQFMHSYQQRTGSMPTRVEIAQALGAKSANTAEEHVQALRRRGLLTITSGTSRGVQFTTAAFEVLGVLAPRALRIAPEHLIALPVVDQARIGRSV